MVLREDGFLSYYKIRDAPKSAADLPRPVGVIDVGREGRAIRQRRDVGGAAIAVLDWPAAATDTTALCLATTRRVYFLVAKTSREALLWYSSLKDVRREGESLKKRERVDELADEGGGRSCDNPA
jgi:hypothetical protein